MEAIAQDNSVEKMRKRSLAVGIAHNKINPVGDLLAAALALSHYRWKL